MVKTVTVLDELDHPNDFSVFYCENSHYYFIIFFKPFKFPVSPCKYYEKSITLWLVYCIVHLDIHDYIKGCKIVTIRY